MHTVPQIKRTPGRFQGQTSKVADHGGADLSPRPHICAMSHMSRRGDGGGGVLTAVLLVRVVLAVVVAVAQPGAADAFAVVAVEVHR